MPENNPTSLPAAEECFPAKIEHQGCNKKVVECVCVCGGGVGWGGGGRGWRRRDRREGRGGNSHDAPAFLLMPPVWTISSASTRRSGFFLKKLLRLADTAPLLPSSPLCWDFSPPSQGRTFLKEPEVGLSSILQAKVSRQLNTQCQFSQKPQSDICVNAVSRWWIFCPVLEACCVLESLSSQEVPALSLSFLCVCLYLAPRKLGHGYTVKQSV